MRIGYARVSTDDQTLDLQRDALKKSKCREIYEEQASGKNTAWSQNNFKWPDQRSTGTPV